MPKHILWEETGISADSDSPIYSMIPNLTPEPPHDAWHVVTKWANADATDGTINIAYSDDPTDPDSWVAKNGLHGSDNKAITFDTASGTAAFDLSFHKYSYFKLYYIGNSNTTIDITVTTSIDFPKQGG